MARIIILVMIPIAALLVWRDVVVERQLAVLASYGAYDEWRERDRQRQIAARDGALDDAMWSLMLGNTQKAKLDLARAENMRVAAPPPDRLWTLRFAADCVDGKIDVPLEEHFDTRPLEYCRSLR